jgi:hypothetical protein
MRKRDDKRTMQPDRQIDPQVYKLNGQTEENHIKKYLKNDPFILMLFDDLLNDSELTQEDVDDLDHRMKREMMGEAGMQIVLDRYK